MERNELTTKEMGTNTMNPQFGLFNLEQKKKPYDVKIKNFNPNEPKVKQSIKYTSKQNYRRYKTLTEPSLLSSIKIDDTDDMVSKIQKAFGIKPDPKRNFTEVETAKLPNSQGLSYVPPNIATVEPKLGGSIYYDEYTDEDRAKIREAKRLIDEDGSRAFLSKDSIPEGGWDELKAYMVETDKKLKARSEEEASARDESVARLMEESRREKEANLFGDISTELIEGITEILPSTPLDLLKPPEVEEGDTLDLEDETKRERDDMEMAIFGNLDVEDARAPSEISAKTTEAPGSVALEAERTEALTSKRGRKSGSKNKATIDKERNLQEELEKERESEIKKGVEKKSKKAKEAFAMKSIKSKDFEFNYL